MIDSFMSSEGRLGRLAYVVRLFVLVALASGVTWGAIVYFNGWHDGDYSSLGPFLGILAALFCAMTGLMQLLKRLRDMGKPAYWTLSMLIPGVNLLVLLYTMVAPSRES